MLSYVTLSEVHKPAKDSSVNLCAHNRSAKSRSVCGFWGSSEPASKISLNQNGRKDFLDLVWIAQTPQAAVRILSLSPFC